MLKPIAAKTFDEYALNVFLSSVKGHLQNALRVDIIWDQYFDNSLKSQARDKRGKGIRRSPLAPCDHEEANSRMMLHLTDAVHRGF